MKNKKINIKAILASVMFFSTIIPAKAYEINDYLNESTFTSEAFYYDSER